MRDATRRDAEARRNDDARAFAHCSFFMDICKSDISLTTDIYRVRGERRESESNFTRIISKVRDIIIDRVNESTVDIDGLNFDVLALCLADKRREPSIGEAHYYRYQTSFHILTGIDLGTRRATEKSMGVNDAFGRG